MGLSGADLAALVERYPAMPALLGLAWVFALAGVSALVRVRRGKPVFAHVPKDAIFTEKWASGRSFRNLITRFGRANNALLVAVTPTKLIVRPHFPFTLLFLPEIYGLELEVTPSQLRGAEERQVLWRKSVVVEYALPGRGDEQMELRLKDRAGFLDAIQTLKGRRPSR